MSSFYFPVWNLLPFLILEGSVKGFPIKIELVFLNNWLSIDEHALLSFYYIFISNGSEEDTLLKGGVSPRSREPVVWP